eukprot:gene29021-32218_t
MQSSFVGTARAFQPSRVAIARPARVTTVQVENRVALRFQRGGRKHLPFYRLVAIDSRDRRDGKPLEYLGWYDPLKKSVNLNAPQIKSWLADGAQPSDTVKNLLKKAFIIAPDPIKVVLPKDPVKAVKA